MRSGTYTEVTDTSIWRNDPYLQGFPRFKNANLINLKPKFKQNINFIYVPQTYLPIQGHQQSKTTIQINSAQNPTQKRKKEAMEIKNQTCWTKLVCMTTRTQKRATATPRQRYSSVARILGVRSWESIPESRAWTRRNVCSGSIKPQRSISRVPIPLSGERRRSRGFGEKKVLFFVLFCFDAGSFTRNYRWENPVFYAQPPLFLYIYN